MENQDHNRINSIKARPTTAISLNSSEAQSSYDALAEIRDDYSRAKERLKRYNKFIDNHKPVTILIPLLLIFVALLVLAANSSTSGNSSPIISIIALVAIGLFLAAFFILAFVCGWRESSKAKIENRLKELREEVAQYHRATALGEKNISRDELGLFQESLAKKQNETTKESGGLIVLGWIAIIVRIFTAWGAISTLSIIASIAALIISIVLVVSKNPTNKSNGKVILIIWIVIVSIVFIVAFNKAQQAQQAQQTQVQPSYYNSYQ